MATYEVSDAAKQAIREAAAAGVEPGRYYKNEAFVVTPMADHAGATFFGFNPPKRHDVKWYQAHPGSNGFVIRWSEPERWSLAYDTRNGGLEAFSEATGFSLQKWESRPLDEEVE